MCNLTKLELDFSRKRTRLNENILWSDGRTFAICKHKVQRGLGITNSNKLNLALVTKWIWKISQNDDSLWARILKAKYSLETSLLRLRAPKFGEGSKNGKRISTWALASRPGTGETPNFGLLSGSMTGLSTLDILTFSSLHLTLRSLLAMCLSMVCSVLLF